MKKFYFCDSINEELCFTLDYFIEEMKNLIYLSLIILLSSCGNNEPKEKEISEYEEYNQYYQVVEVVYVNKDVDTITINYGYPLDILIRKKIPCLYAGYNYGMIFAYDVRSFSVLEYKLKE